MLWDSDILNLPNEVCICIIHILTFSHSHFRTYKLSQSIFIFERFMKQEKEE
jgi:hypothetical protein